MKIKILSGITLLMLASWLSCGAHGPDGGHSNEAISIVTGVENGEIIGHGAFKYRVHMDWGKLDAKKYPIKNCHAMVQLKSGDFVALCDDTRHNFLLYSPEGKLKKAWMTEYPGAHGIELFEENGKEFFIVVDSGWAVRAGKQLKETGRVAKTTTNGQLVFSLGHPQTVGAYQPGQKYMPCDAAVAPNGDIYVADGYGSQWVSQYDKHGVFIRKFGGAQDSDAHARLNGSHGISIDLRAPKTPKVIVSSRSANQLKMFSLDGRFIETVDLPGAYGGQAVVHGDNLYVGVCWSSDGEKRKTKPNSGFIAILDRNNKVISCPGGTAPVYIDGKVQRMHQQGKTFKHVHDLCVDTLGNIYVVQWNAQGAYPMKLELITEQD